MAVNWGLAGNGAQNALATGLHLGQLFRQNQRDNALLEIRRAELAERQETQAQEAARKRQEQRRADMPMVARLLDFAAQGEPQYQQARGIAQQYGIDVSQLPETFDPAWIEQQRTMVKALADPAKMEALSTAGKQAVDMGYKPGTPEFNSAVRDIFTASEAKPYVVGGETRLYQPKIGGPGQVQGSAPPAAVEALRRGEGTPEQFDEMFGPGAAARVMGGPAAAPQTPFDRAFAALP